MIQSRKTIVVIIIGVIILFSSLVFPLLFLLYRPSTFFINFTPNTLKSYPGHTAWLIGEISSQNSPLQNSSILIEANMAVNLDYKFWNNSQYKKIVEIFVTPNNTHLNKTIIIQISIFNNDFSITNSASIEVIDWAPKNISGVIEMRNAFVSYFSTKLKSTCINESTIWEGLDNAPKILIVEHYLFKSEFWELELARHVTITPYDWIKVYLRPRNQIKPTWAGMIQSWSSGNYNS